MAKARALLSTGPAQVAIDCGIVMFGTVAMLLVLADHVWEAVIPGAIAIGLQAIDERVADESVLSRPYVIFRRLLFGGLLVGAVAGLWLHAATRDWSVAIHAALLTLLLAALVLAHTPWAHWLKRLGGNEDGQNARREAAMRNPDPDDERGSGEALRVLVAVVVAPVVLLAPYLAAGCSPGASYEQEEGPRLARSEQAHFHYENDLEYVCDEAKFSKEARVEARQLERLLRSKPDHLFRMQVASSDEPGDLDEDVTVREFAVLSLDVLRKRASRSSPRSQCFKRHATQLARAIADSR